MSRFASLRILVALIAGLLAGALLAGTTNAGAAMTVARPIGQLWLDALTMTVVPLVFGLILTGIAGAARQAETAGLTTKTLVVFAIGLVAACAVSAGVSMLVLEAWPVPEAAAAMQAPGGMPPPVPAGGDWFAGILPKNPIKAAAETAITPLVLFTLIFSFAVMRIEAEPRDALLRVFRAVVDAMLVIVRWVLLLAPIGVFALALQVGINAAAGAVGVLFQYVVVVATCCLAVTLLAAIAGALFGPVSPARFLRAVAPPQVVAVSTQSSLATLPAMFEASAAIGVDRAQAGVVLPLAVSIFRVSSAAANVAVTVYLAHVHGVALGAVAIAALVLVGAAVSVAAVGLPAQVSFFATIGPVCLAAGVPIGLLPLLLAVESVPDIFRTLGNVTADLTVTALVGGRQAMPGG